ncbi:RNA polymerase sigma factor [Puniceicoccaceae bacterium K14]|nr:RNA polymerase sigma factor [Puniceicoccaceae bacterium K14]
MNIEKLVTQAVGGDKTALEGAIAAIRDDVYYLALRMLANPEDAADATQEILVKVVTKLSSFRFDSSFKTWVYRVATNCLITQKKRLEKYAGLTFEMYKADLESDLQSPDAFKERPDYPVLLNELRISCTMAMLLCLTPPYRIAYILGDILELSQGEASSILEISKENYRKRLSRARKEVVEFTSKSCGLKNDCAACSCDRKLTGSINRLRIKLGNTPLADGASKTYEEVKRAVAETQESLRTIELQRSIEHYRSPIELGQVIEAIAIEGVKGNLSNS